MNDLDNQVWSGRARRCADFMLDAGMEAPDYVPGCLLPDGTVKSPLVSPSGLPKASGLVLTADAAGREAALAAHYALLLLAARESGWNGRIRAFQCLEVNLVVLLPGEHPLVIDMFGGAALAADEMLGVLAAPSAPAAVVYDNLDQGWALRVLIEAEDVVLLDWDWERPLTEQVVRAIRLDRAVVARQAAAAQVRLRALHAGLIEAVGIDLWTVPAQPPALARGRGWRGFFGGR